MIVYQSTKSKFLDDHDNLDIEEVIAHGYLQRTGRYAPGLKQWSQATLSDSTEIGSG
ncbi:hypothetical protein [Lysobacter sp. cf310]|uniref:hypothetical protein n=1 Tax=Lysobacter sp. cf310 TaxID=1761790 RepID=UPI0015872E20|nr:hypothetical protein [Lysobacter sp. cf310]